MYRKSTCIYNNSMIYEEYLLRILKSEAQIAECLQKLFCESFVEELKYVEPIEKRVALAQSIICAYASKEKAMSELIKALKIPPARYYPIKKCCTQSCKAVIKKY